MAFASSSEVNSVTPIVHRGFAIGPRECRRIQRVIDANPDITRMELALRVCAMFGWRRSNGEMAERSCRSFLERLSKLGLIRQPGAWRSRKPPSSPRIGIHSDGCLPSWPEGDDRQDSTAPLLVRPILPVEKDIFRLCLERHHYLGFRPLVGESLCYAAFWNGEPVAILAWAAASLKNTHRDTFIGWDEQAKQRGLGFVVQNVRFLILPDTAAPKNLASRVLAACLRRLSRDWQARYRHPIHLAETFVDESRFKGTCYRAANWIRLGLTQGYGRHGTTYHHHGRPKAVWLYLLRSDALRRLCQHIPPSIPAEEDTIMFDPECFPLAGEGGLLDVIGTIHDFRDPRGTRHPLKTILAIAVLAALRGYTSFESIAQFGKRLPCELRRRLGATRDKAPSEPTLRRVFKGQSADIVETTLNVWQASLNPQPPTAVAVDGKTIRGSRDGQQAPVHLLSAFLPKEGIVVGQIRVPDKTNESPCIKDLLKDIPIEGAMITADAMHTQRETARFLVEDKKADYLFIVKDNQPTLREDIEFLGLTSQEKQAETVDKGHGRLEIRRIWTSTDLIGYLDFPYHQQVFQIERIREYLTTGKIEHEVVCGITSRAANKASPEQLLEFARQHWAIENRLHWVRDVTFTEDHSQVRKGNAPQLLASIRNLAIGMCRLAGITAIADAIRLFTDRLDLACRLIGL